MHEEQTSVPGEGPRESKAPTRLKSAFMNLLLVVFGLVLFLVLGEITSRVLHLDEKDRLVTIDEEDILDFKGLFRLSENTDLVFELIPGAERELTSGKKEVRYVINSHGFRDVEFSVRKDPGVFRILVLGDSMIFGPAVSLEDTLAKQLGEILNSETGGTPHFEVLNLGVSGYNTYQEWALLENRGSQYDPDLVVVAFCANDVGDPRRHVRAHTLGVLGELPDALVPGGMSETGVPEPTSTPSASPGVAEVLQVRGKLPIPFKGLLRQNSAFYRFLTRRYDALLKRIGLRSAYGWAEYYAELDGKLSSYDTPEWAWLRTQFERFQLFSEETGVPWVFVHLPWQYQLAKGYPPLPQQLVTDYAREEGFLAVDLRPAFVRENRWDLYVDLGHFSERGHQLAAQELHRALDHLDLLSD